MREISAKDITQTVKRLCIEANGMRPKDVKAGLEQQLKEEPWPPARELLEQLLENQALAATNHVPICQDTGAACIFVKLGQEVHIDGHLEEAIHEGVRQGYAEGYLRKSMVRDPLQRVNTGDNTPAIITYDVVPGDALKITVAPKGFEIGRAACRESA